MRDFTVLPTLLAQARVLTCSLHMTPSEALVFDPWCYRHSDILAITVADGQVGPALVHVHNVAVQTLLEIPAVHRLVLN